MKAKLYTIQDGNLQEGMRIQDMPVPQLIVGNGVKIPINWPETGFTTSIERTATGYGCGGGGAASQGNTDKAGGTGGGGLIIIEEYF
jgi:uncharacterized spore protein YtfJ